MPDSTFAIVNLRGGERRDITSFLLDNDSFPALENAYLFRGRIERRSCTEPVGIDGRLKGIIGTTTAGGVVTIGFSNAGAIVGIPIITGISQFTLSGATLTDPGGASPIGLLETNPAVTGTLNRATGVLTTNQALVPVTYFPSLPVMGLSLFEQQELNDELLFAFDTRWTYLFNRGANDFEFENQFRTPTVAGDTFVWTGTDSDFFWSINYFRAFWTTNNVPGLHATENNSVIAEGDGIRWYSDDVGGTGWNNFNPPINAAGNSFLLGCLCIVPYKGRLLTFNTVEGASLVAGVRQLQRCRWSAIGTPFYGNAPTNAGTNASAWDSDTPGQGGFIDAPTSEAIVSVEFIKDTLIVYFERSTWQLVYTNNETFPFYFQKINTELGCESTFSVVPFDRGVFAVGNYGITTCDSVNVQRIDQKIPDEVFRIQNLNEGPKRVHGIRDYNAQLVYWNFPVQNDYDNQSPTYALTYPNQLLVYNYLDGSWSQFDDNFTCFGYWQKLADITWAQLPYAWQTQQMAWNSQVLQAKYPDVVAGNQRGYVAVFSQLNNLGLNMASLSISDITNATATLYIPNHNLVDNDYILITGVQGTTSTTGLNGVIFRIDNCTLDTFEIYVDSGPVIPVLTGTYTGGGLVTHIPNIYIQTKQFNPFYEQGSSVRFTYLDMLASRTDLGQITTDFYLDDDTSNVTSSKIVQTSPETAFNANQGRIWHRIYTDSYGSFVQLVATLSDAQMRDLSITTSAITIHGLVFYLTPAGRLPYEF